MAQPGQQMASRLGTKSRWIWRDDGLRHLHLAQPDAGAELIEQVDLAHIAIPEEESAKDAGISNAYLTAFVKKRNAILGESWSIYRLSWMRARA